MNRRDFIRSGGSCVGYLGLWSTLVPPAVGALFGARPLGTVPAAEPWGRIESLGEGVWACISTPLTGGSEAMRTFSNGGIVSGRSGVLVVEGFASDEGARWISQMAQQLTGKSPSHAVLTHYHGDHSAGLRGYQASAAAPTYVTTAITRDLLRPSRAPIADLLSGAQLVAPATSTVIDLGGRQVTITPRAGHTNSDLSVTVEDPRVIFAGDLVWNGLFPNYVDATPSILSQEVRALGKDDRAIKVPGHGSLPTGEEFSHYVALLDLVEDAARRAHDAGRPAEITARDFVVPASLGQWGLFGQNYYQVALRAWERELTK